MGLIYKQIRFRGEKRSKVLRALMDTGASVSFIRATEAREIGKPRRTMIPFPVEFGKGTAMVREKITLVLSLNGHRVPWDFNVLPGLTEAVVIGADFFQVFRIKLDPKREDIVVDPQYLKLKLV